MPLRKAYLYFIMEATTIIVLKEVYLASQRKCLFITNFLSLRESSSHKSCLPSATCFVLQFHLEDTTLFLSGLGTISRTSFQYSSMIASIMSSFCQVINVSQSSSTLKVGTHFTLGKVLVHQEAIHHVIPCRTHISSVVTPPEAQHHLPFAFCTGVTVSILFYYVSILGYQIPIFLYLEFCQNVPLAPC